MNEQISRRLLVLLVTIVGLGGFGVALGSLAMADSTTTNTLNRDLDPVVISGAAVAAFVGFPVDELFVYAYSGGDWTQLPAQVDEITATGTYTTTEDDLLDTNDEIVFMAKDLGDQAPPTMPITGSLPVSAGWYEIEVTDPISPEQRGWAYLVHSRTLTPTFPADYVDFDPRTHRINGETYSLGFATPHPWADYLTLGDSGVDILDRTKMRLLCQIILLCPIKEDPGSPLQDDLIIDGPVRIIVRGGRVHAYGSMARWTMAINVPSSLAGDVRFSMDFSPTVVGATYYNAVVPPGGVPVDGDPDAVAAQPLSPWWQLSTDTGTLIQVADTSLTGGTQSNYYKDNAAWDASDTGDHRSYGDTGVYIANPNLSFSYSFNIYTLPGRQPQMGETYEAFFNQPLAVKTQLFGDPRPEKIYLPSILLLSF